MRLYFKRGLETIAALLLAALCSLMPLQAAADALLPGVSAEMCDAEYWIASIDAPDAILADRARIAQLNADFIAAPECRMNDLLADYAPYDGAALRRQLALGAMRDVAAYAMGSYYLADGREMGYGDFEQALEAISGAEARQNQCARFGICVTPGDVRALPTQTLITDERGDLDYDVLQLANVRVNEPVVIRAETAGGDWYYCDTSCVSGWIPAESVAVCEDRAEWLKAWSIADEDALVVTGGRIYLDRSDYNPASSERMLTMGTVLRRVNLADFDPMITNRAAYCNYAVYLPTRAADGGYGVTIALVPMHCGVSLGYMELTARNLLGVAFEMLGDAYGWGGKHSAPDCSLYVRNVYKCFGLELPRNTTWQSAMPAWNRPLSEMDGERKSNGISELPVGAILFFSGHEMLYIGERNGKNYVLSAVSSIMDPLTGEKQRVRSVIINSLEDTRRPNGNSWLSSVERAVVPYLGE